MEWVRGEAIGHGSFSTVSLATTCSFDQIAVKSSDLACSSFLKHEKEVLDILGNDNPNIIRCLGADITSENSGRLYNLLLEYAPGGTLADKVNKSGGKLGEKEVQRYTRSVLKGLRHVHSKGFAHLDIKPQNLLLSGNGDVKIADFGLAKRIGEKEGRVEIRGTPLYMAPESVSDNEYDSPCDIWALGCALVEMASARTVWNKKGDGNMMALLMRIGAGDEVPGVPEELSEEGKDFLRMCFVKDPRKRWTAEMLLGHPFLCGLVDEEEAPTENASPRGIFDFPDEWAGSPVRSSASVQDTFFGDWSSDAAERVQQLACDRRFEWVDSGRSWISVR